MMAVAMEVGWRGPELGSASYSHMKLKAPPAATTSSSSWGGADPQKVLQLMMGHRPTLDLFGNASSSPAEVDDAQPDEFVELDPDLPLPSEWEKCLDLKVSLAVDPPERAVVFLACTRSLLSSSTNILRPSFLNIFSPLDTMEKTILFLGICHERTRPAQSSLG